MQLSAHGEGPWLGEMSTSISPTPPGGLEDSGDTDLLMEQGDGEQEVRGCWRCWGAERQTGRESFVGKSEMSD